MVLLGMLTRETGTNPHVQRSCSAHFKCWASNHYRDTSQCFSLPREGVGRLKQQRDSNFSANIIRVGYHQQVRPYHLLDRSGSSENRSFTGAAGR